VTRVHKLRVRAARESGYTLIEMLTVMAIMGVVMGGITSLFVSGINAESDQNARFQSQLNARLSLDKLRREVHPASCITVSGTSATISGVTYYPTMSEGGTGTGCNTASYTWCTASVSNSTTRYALYRQAGSTCASNTGTKYADYLTTGTIFAYNTTSNTNTGPTGSLPKLTVNIAVNRRPTKTAETYTLNDDIVLRNGKRG
jgi:prepilin-type N-terminal cleavage/methylation domain-containing protein